MIRGDIQLSADLELSRAARPAEEPAQDTGERQLVMPRR
jgi:hypothetical protein